MSERNQTSLAGWLNELDLLAKHPNRMDGWVRNAIKVIHEGLHHHYSEALNRRAPSAEQHQSDDLPANEEIATHWCKELVAALKRLSFAAQTTGGTAGRDEELCAAINQAEEALSIGATNRALLAAEQQQREPVAWLHTMDNTEGIPGNEPKRHLTFFEWNPFGVPGRDYSETFPVTSQPLYTHQQPPVQSLSQRMAEAGFTPRKSPKTAGGLIREDEQPQVQGEPNEFAEIEALAAQIAGMLPSQQMAHAAATLRKKITDVRWRRLFGQPRAAAPDGIEIHDDLIRDWAGEELDVLFQGLDQHSVASVIRNAINRADKYRAEMSGEQPRAAVPDVTDAMAIAFHSALTDGSIGQSEVDEIKKGLRAALVNRPSAAVPDDYKLVPIEPDKNMVEAAFDALADLGFDMTRNDMSVEDMKQALAKGIAAAPARPNRAAVPDVDKIMAQAQVFASSWSLVGGQFDDGSMLETAEQEKEALRQMLTAAAPAQPGSDFGLPVAQEPKYNVNAQGRIFNRVSGEVIPDDEPVMIFRARDNHAAPMIAFYRKLCADSDHRAIVGVRLHDFVDFIHAHPDRMKEPDTAQPGEGE